MQKYKLLVLMVSVLALTACGKTNTEINNSKELVNETVEEKNK